VPRLRDEALDQTHPPAGPVLGPASQPRDPPEKGAG
jgi:hypothetical protein